ncbi:serine hydrolase domain-containing protein [Leeuwenhoekiella aestuarii]|uniref:CubicO group peptidase (Beta-lactamase class C family) n=1 Tax=Leeuwenhoekiella aestuarii TaxID=2249426 RepID=A0A4Q0NR69_9FLAO|nr:serine hydrolase domain-containing protein [Leeuwenhoekiella aestuarii]RXG13142.1 CubicO group peptidase (beta-lactamase class C family) [Leeuwenhoekiella aestuarii]
MKILNTILKNITVAIVALTAITSCAQTKSIQTLEGSILHVEELNSAIESAMKEHELPGLSAAIINNNELVYHQAFGVANSKTREPIDKQSIFEGASLSKPIFAYFVMKLVENGTIDLDKPLHQYLPHPGIAPESKEEYKLITARMVLAHQTGFPNHANNEPIKLAFTPGTDFMYSGEAYQYLAAVIGTKLGIGWKKELNQLFQEKVTNPLNMPHTTFVWDDYLESHKVFGHDKEGLPTYNKPGKGRWSGKTFNAFSSVHSEASEYAKFIIAMLKKEGLSDSSFSEMLKEQTKFKDSNPLKIETGQTGWGLGFTQKRTEKGIMHMHTGNNHDFQAYTMFVPEQKYGIVLFTNSGNLLPFIEAISNTLGKQF